MISASVCLSSQPDTAVQPAKEFCSYTTCWDTIGKPTDNAFAELFNGKFRTECLNVFWFLSLDDAAAKCEAWRRDYNEVRPHSAIGNQTPLARAFASAQACLT